MSTSNTFLSVVRAVSPTFETINSEIYELRKNNPNLNNHKLADKYCSSIINKYTSIGIASALPSVIPGLGTAVQIGTEVATVSADLAMMLRYMSAITYGVAKIYERENINEFDNEFIFTLGLWCGAIQAARGGTIKLGTKVALSAFNKKVPAEIFRKINQKVGTTILTKWGSKRGGIALGKLIPFGVGAAVSGGFNYTTMQSFKKAAIARYADYGKEEEYIIID